jgi:hypothetical protein
MNALRRLWGEQRLALVAFLLALSLAGFFGGRMVTRALYWADPAHHRQTPEGWMTPGYIARSWHLEPAQVDAILGVDDSRALAGGARPTLATLAKALDVPLSDLIARLDAVLPKAAGAAPPELGPPPSGPPK